MLRVQGDKATHSTKSTLGVVFLVVAVDYASVGMMRTLLPFLARQHSTSATLIGALESAYGLGQICGSLILGRLSDRLGRRWVLLFSLAGSAFGYALAAFAPSAGVLLLSRLPIGVAKQTVTVSRAMVADVSFGAARSATMARLMAACAAGYAFGPVLGAIIAARFGETAAALTAALLFVLLLPLVAFGLSETSPLSASPTSWHLQHHFNELRRHDAGLCRLLLVFALPEAALVMFSTTVLSVIAVKDLGQSRLWLGSINSAMAVGAGVVSGLILPILVHRIGDRALLGWGCGAYGAASALLALVLTPTSIYVSVLPFAIGISILRSAPASILSQRLPPEMQGEGLGILDSVSSICRVICPMACGALIDLCGSRALLLVQVACCWIAFAFVALWYPSSSNIGTKKE